MRAADLARRAMYEAATLGWSSRAIVLPAARQVRHGVVVDGTTDLVVEGFARSGNSLAVAAIAAAQPGPIRIAHHVHAPAHVLEAVRLRRPVLLVIREPAYAAIALVESKPFLTPNDAVRGWARFHEPLLRVRSRLVVATFEQVHEDLASVVERVNERFGTGLVPPGAADVAAATDDAGSYFAEREGRGLPLIGRTGAPAPVDGRPSRPSGGTLERAQRLYRAFVSA